MMFMEYVVVLLFVLCEVRAQDPVVEIDTGFVTGRTVDYKDKQVHAFYSIPYARPPVGELRFRAPQPAEKWEGPLDVSASKPNACYQIKDEFFGDFEGSETWNPVTPMSEDCLYITVYVPAKQPPISDAHVMIWIHGGGFYSGSNALPVYDGRALAAEHDVIVVSMNYRLGPLGFLFLDDDEAPGNMGLMDQELALDWVQRNIEAFGGNKNKVTLFGESAGAGSVGLHLIHRRSWDKFEKAILASGSMNMGWNTVFSPEEEQIRVNKLVHEALECPEGNVSDVVACLRNLDAKKITDEQFVSKDNVGPPIGPVVDGKWIRDDPSKMLKEHKFKKCPIMAGVNTNEASYFMIYELPDFLDLDGYSMNQDQLKSSIRQLFALHYDYPNVTHTSSVGIAAIEDRLTYWEDPNNQAENYRLLEEAYGISKFSCPVIELQKEYAEEGQVVYAYYFTHRSEENVWPEYLGVMHGDDIFYTFGDPFMREHLYTDEDREVSAKVMKYWADFAKSGNPDSDWPRFTEADQKYLEISHKYLSDPSQGVGNRLYAEGCHFWMELMPILNEEGYCVNAGPVGSHLNFSIITMAALIVMKLL